MVEYLSYVISGRNSMVECQLPKLKVASSSLVARFFSSLMSSEPSRNNIVPIKDRLHFVGTPARRISGLSVNFAGIPAQLLSSIMARLLRDVRSVRGVF
jgi:hypothetical protein